MLGKHRTIGLVFWLSARRRFRYYRYAVDRINFKLKETNMNASAHKRRRKVEMERRRNGGRQLLWARDSLFLLRYRVISNWKARQVQFRPSDRLESGVRGRRQSFWGSKSCQYLSTKLVAVRDKWAAIYPKISFPKLCQAIDWELRRRENISSLNKCAPQLTTWLRLTDCFGTKAVHLSPDSNWGPDRDRGRGSGIRRQECQKLLTSAALSSPDAACLSMSERSVADAEN